MSNHIILFHELAGIKEIIIIDTYILRLEYSIFQVAVVLSWFFPEIVGRILLILILLIFPCIQALLSIKAFLLWAKDNNIRKVCNVFMNKFIVVLSLMELLILVLFMLTIIIQMYQAKVGFPFL